MLGWELPPHNSGGLGVACYQLCKALSNSGADIDFILPYTSNEKYPFMKVTPATPQGVLEITKSGIAYDSHKYFYTDGSEAWVDILDQQQMYENSVARLVESKQFDVIHAHDWLTFRAGLRAKQISGQPLILHVHSIEYDRAGGNHGNPLVREIEELSMLLADRIIAVSHHTKKMIIQEYNIPADKIEVIHNSVGINEIYSLAEQNAYHYLEHMKSRGYKVIASIGRLTIQKGLTHLLQAAQKVIEQEPKTFFLFVGSGEQYTELIELAAELKIADKVLFTGFQRGKSIRDAYAVADLFVMPSVSEPFGLTPLEAIGYGTPTMISKQSGVSEVLTNCLKVDFWDINQMANLMISAIRHESLRNELYKQSFNEYQQLSWNQAAGKLMGMYHHHANKALV